MYTCPNCGFVCASSQLMEAHLEREKTGLTEREYRRKAKKKIRKQLEKKISKRWE